MKRSIGLRAGSLFLSVAALLATAAPAAAIVNGAPDGDEHPSVGLLAAVVPNVGFMAVCSGTLIAPDVFLTAGHCTGWLQAVGVDRAYVTFDSVASGLSEFHGGTLYTHPYFNKTSSNPADLGVVVLDSPIVGVVPAELPTAGLLDAMSQNRGLADQLFGAVGYGAIGWFKPDYPVQGGKVWYSDFVRRQSAPRFKALNDNRIHTSQNPALGDSGTCYGDSGGPNYIGDSNVLAGITMTGDHVCRSTNIIYRLDTPTARWFLSRFVRLP